MLHPNKTNTTEFSVEVEAPARLHLGFLDLNGGLGRRFGSIGLTIETLSTRLSAERASEITASGPGHERALQYAQDYLKVRGFKGGVEIHLQQKIPDHVGLGSGTQMALAVGTAIERLYGGAYDSAAIAGVLKRGKRSGIGIGAFDQGGFILDCGKAENDGIPPVPVRLAFPEAWRILLIFDTRSQGLHGTDEITAFSKLAQFPAQGAAHLCRLVMMQLLPGVMERQIAPVSSAVGEIQQMVGDHFAPAQGGRFTSPAVTAALTWAREHGYAGIGQSSWGPTGFVLLESAEKAEKLEQALKQAFGDFPSFRCIQVAARNQGATVNLLRHPTRLMNNKRAR